MNHPARFTAEFQVGTFWAEAVLVSTPDPKRRAREQATDVRLTTGRANVAAAYKPSRGEKALRQVYLIRAAVAQSDIFFVGPAESLPFLRLPNSFVKQECFLDPAHS